MFNYRAALVIAMFVSTPTWAIVIPYGDFDGTDVMYLAVTEDTRDSPEALFGAPSVLGNTLDFDPLSFSAGVSSVSGTSNSQIVDGQLNFTLMSRNDAFGLGDVIITEGGDFTLAGLGNAQASASVASPVRWTITHVDGAAITPVSGSDNLAFTPNAGSYSLPNDLGTGVLWDGSLTVDVAGFAVANGITGRVTKVDFSIDNVLSVSAADGGSASIFKKDFNGVVIEAPVPEPATASLSILGLLVTAACMRKRRQR